MQLTRQARIVLDHLRHNTHLTSWQAEGVYRIRRLASRIHDLKLAGFEIVKETAQDATGQRYTRYSLSAKQRRRKGPINPMPAARDTAYDRGYDRGFADGYGSGYSDGDFNAKASPVSPDDCENCGCPLAHDAAYCHHCGEEI